MGRAREIGSKSSNAGVAFRPPGDRGKPAEEGRAGAPVEETPATRQWPIPPAGLALAGRLPGKRCQPAAGAQIRLRGGREGGERKSQGRVRIAKGTAPGCTSFLARQGGFPALGLPLLPPSDRSWPGACQHLPRGKLLSRGAGLSGLRS